MLENLPLGRLLLYHIREDQRLAVAAAAAAVPRLGVAVTGSTIALPGGAGQAGAGRAGAAQG
jgi:hypothetical protein